MTYSWRKGMLTWDWGALVLGSNRGFLSFNFPNCNFTTGLPDERAQ